MGEMDKTTLFMDFALHQDVGAKTVESRSELVSFHYCCLKAVINTSCF